MASAASNPGHGELVPLKIINPYKLFQGSFVPNWLMERQEISQGAKLVYARLMQYAGEDGMAYPKQRSLAKDVGVSMRQITNYLKELEETGLVVSEGANGEGRQYQFLEHDWMGLTCEDKCVPYEENCVPTYEENFVAPTQESAEVPTKLSAYPPTKKTAYNNRVITTIEENQCLRESLEEDHLRTDMSGRLDVLIPEQAVDRDALVRQVFEFWAQHSKRPGSKLTEKRKKKIRERLKTFSADDLKKAVEGAQANPFMTGENDRNTAFNYPETIFRDDDTTERHIQYLSQPKQRPKFMKGMASGVITTAEEREKSGGFRL